VSPSVARGIQTAIVLAMTLFSAGCTHETKKASGHILDVASATPPCGDSPRIVLVSAVAAHRARINDEPDAPIPDVVVRMREIMSTRAEKVVYVKGEVGASWGDFIQMVEVIWQEADLVSIVTPGVQAQLLQTHCLRPSCGACSRLVGSHKQDR
jgi:hypothetical protein